MCKDNVGNEIEQGVKKIHPVIEEDICDICEEILPWWKLKGKTILVTGANGFLASYLVYTLLELNKKYEFDIKINALCRNKQRAEQKFGDAIKDGIITMIYQDVCDEIADTYKSDIVIHAASPSTPYIVQKHPYQVFEANVLAYDKLLKKCREWHTSDVLLFSSSAVYGYETPLSGVCENYREKVDFTNCKDIYCMSKQMLEMMTESVRKELDCRFHIVRPFVVYGPGEVYSHKKCMTDFLKNCICEEDIVMKSAGNVIRSYIYIKDAVKAMFYILLKGDQKAYNIASEMNICSIKELAELFCSIDGNIQVKCEESTEEYLQSRSRAITGKNDRLKELGWKEETSLEEGLRRTIRWAERDNFLEM